jgi:hypothetical protein
MLESFILLGILHFTAVLVPALILKDSIRNGKILLAWLVVGAGLVVHAVPSVLLVFSLPTEGGYFVYFASLLALVPMIIWILVAACIALFTKRVATIGVRSSTDGLVWTDGARKTKPEK